MVVKNWTDITSATNARILEWAEAQSWARAMATCNQDAQWHAEGDVWTHTKMVYAELQRLEQWPSLDRLAQLKLLFTALFHDSGKPATTVVDPETGRTRSPKHALVGGFGLVVDGPAGALLALEGLSPPAGLGDIGGQHLHFRRQVAGAGRA